MEQADTTDVVVWREQLKALLGSDAQYYPSRLEVSYPRILGNIVASWGKPELDAYFSELMVTDRSDRQGFPGDVAMEIFHLSNIHSGLHLSDKGGGTGWAGIQDAEVYRRALQKDVG